MIKPDPNPTVIDLTTMFSSNRSEHCPITRWAVKTSKGDINTDVNPNSTEAVNFYVPSETSNLNTFPGHPGIWSFYVLAMTEELKHAY
jgi:hypothetical protein